jgi:ABC-type nickel/cobalt efflux system permease component RcnA
MELREGIRKHGFRKWYSRELTRSHGYLLLLIVCAVGLLSSLAVFSNAASAAQRALDAAAIALLAGVGFWSLRRYFFLLLHAEHVANQAVCSECKTYGRLTVVEGRGPGPNEALRVCCRKCQHQWAIVD